MNRISRISSDWRTARLRERAARGFRVRTIAVVAGLALGAGALAVATASQGPRLEETRVDAAAATAGPGQTLQLKLSRPIAELAPEQLEIVPDVPVTVSLARDTIAVRFDRALAGGVEYRVRVDEVAAASGGTTATIETAFRTPPPSVTYLRPGEDGEAAEVRRWTIGAGEETLFADSGIREFALLDGAVMVASGPDPERMTLSLHALEGGNSEEFVLPEPGRIEHLGIAGSVVLFSLSTAADPLPAYDRTLFRVDLTGDHRPEPVLGLDGAPISITDWHPIPGSPDVIIEARSDDALRYSPALGDPPLIVGTYSEVHGVSPDGRELVAADAFGPIRVPLEGGDATRIEPSPLNGLVPFVGELAVLDDRVVSKAAVPDEDGGAFDVVLAIDDGSSAGELFRPPPGVVSIVSFRPSPGGELLLVELASGGPDGVPRDVTAVLDTRTGEVVRELPGVEARW